jgi:c-di-GMP-related signal transduction protein
MMTELNKSMPNDLPSWVKFLSNTDIPVLKQTARELLELQQDEDALSPRGLSTIITHDPMMTFRLLRYAQTHQHKNQSHDLVTAEQALLMMGMTTFFKDLTPQLLVQDMLKTNLTAQTHLFKLIRRAHRAARFAADWATFLYDMQAEEVYIATLLHDLAEILLLCFSPDEMNKIYAMQLADKTLRSQAAQQQVLGFKVMDLQLELDNASHLPPLLSLLIQGEDSNDRRVKNVTLAVNLARHSTHGWDDAALADDYAEIAQLLRVDVEKVMRMVGAS